MYDAPDTNAFLPGHALSVTDLLVADVTIDDAYAQLPYDMRCPCDVELDAALPWRRPAAVLRELHRRRAADVVAARPCRSCAQALAPELHAPVRHPSDPERIVTLMDAVLDLSGTLFEVVAAGRSLAEVVDVFIGSAQPRPICALPNCRGSLVLRQSGIQPLALSVLGLLGCWAYEAGLSRDIEPGIHDAWTQAVDEVADSAEGPFLTTAELFERASVDPRVVAAETHVPERWVRSDWGTMVRARGESPTLDEIVAELDVRPEDLAVAVLEVANWLADEVDRILAD